MVVNQLAAQRIHEALNSVFAGAIGRLAVFARPALRPPGRPDKTYSICANQNVIARKARRSTNKFKHLPFAGILGEVPPHDWADDLDQLVFTGNCFVDEVFFFHLNSHTVIMADLIQNHPRGWIPG
jgi:hypothetical protein